MFRTSLELDKALPRLTITCSEAVGRLVVSWPGMIDRKYSISGVRLKTAGLIPAEIISAVVGVGLLTTKPITWAVSIEDALALFNVPPSR